MRLRLITLYHEQKALSRGLRKFFRKTGRRMPPIRKARLAAFGMLRWDVQTLPHVPGMQPTDS
jgi:hypothetical protein